uniref:Ataxin 7-like 2a n=1 Tax=Labrus bergylta TaxID=56723 RepID=A0A3Q3G302_9LABR
MAALDRRVPSLDDFVGQSWTAWAEWAETFSTLFPLLTRPPFPSLPPPDMSIFGLYPGHDDFYLVVCSHCGQVVKPQAFEKHCERRHGPLSKLYARLRSPTPAPQPQQRPHHSHSPSHGTNTAASAASSWESRGQGVGQPRAAPPSPSTPPQYRHSKRTPPGRPTPSDRPPSQQGPRKDSPLSSAGQSHRIPRPYNKVASKRECDLDKHCGVLDPDRKKVCTRLLTCNIHSIHQRRKVMGRSKNFDQLVAELKTKVREKGGQSLDGGSSSGRSPSPEAPREQAGAPHCRRPLASLPARSTAASESTPEEENQRQDEGSLRSPSPLVQGRISSDESDAEGAEEHVEFSSSATHPRPLAMCSFGSHALGHGIFTFDRRLHHLRSALSSMLEQHISAHLWNSSLKTASSSSNRGPGRTPTAIPSENSGGGSCSITSSHMGSPSKPMTGRQGGSGRLKNPVGRPSKQTLKLREEAAAAAALRKRKAPSQEGEHSGPERNCILLQDRGRPPSTASSSSSSSSSKPSISSPLPHGQTNGTLSPSSKPRPQRTTHTPLGHSASPDSSSATNNSHSRSGVGDSGLHGQSGGRSFEHQGLVKKRKGGSMEEHSPSSKPSAHRLPSSSSSSSSATSSTPRSNFYPWKESKSGGLAGGVEKKLGTQKVS